MIATNNERGPQARTEVTDEEKPPRKWPTEVTDDCRAPRFLYERKKEHNQEDTIARWLRSPGRNGDEYWTLGHLDTGYWTLPWDRSRGNYLEPAMV